MTKPVWKSIVRRQIQYYVFKCLLESCHSNRKTALLRYNKFKSVDYLTKLDPQNARVLIKARLGMLEVKINSKKKYNYKFVNSVSEFVKSVSEKNCQVNFPMSFTSYISIPLKQSSLIQH